MAEEQLTLVDGMSPSLKRIYQEAEKLNRRMLTLRSNIKDLEKPTSMSYLRRELKETEKQAKLTESALKRAIKVGEREGVLSWNRRYQGVQHHFSQGQKQFIKDQDLIRYGQYIQNTQVRKERALWTAGRTINGLTFDQRVNRAQFLSHFRTPQAFFTPMVQRVNSGLKNLSIGLLNFIGNLFLASSYLTRMSDIIKTSLINPQEQYISNITRVSLTSDRSKISSQMMNELYDTASRTRAPADATIALYNRIALSGVKASNERIRRFVESFNKVTAISGTTAQENRAVMLQLAQGMGSNRLGGDEFRSISEQAPLFKYMLAKGLGVNPGQLKQMGADGKLTAEAILSAMEKVQDQIDLIFKEAPLTIGQTVTILQNKWGKMINNQFTGYLAVRDLIKDIVLWMDTPKGQEIITKIITSWNKFLMTTVMWIRKIAPTIIWIINHLRLVVGIMTSLFILVKAFQLAQWFSVAAAEAGLLGKILKTIGPIILTWLGPLATVLAGITAVVGGIMAVKKLNGEFDYENIKKQQSDKNAFYTFERDIDKYINEKYGSIGMSISAPGSKIKKTAKQQAEEDALNEEKFRALQMKDYLLWQYNEAQKKGIHLKFKPEMLEPFAMKGITGMADSSTNISTTIKNGKLDSVGRINDDVSLDNDGIEMMKMIAERQWTVQNEVTVPQKVEVTIDKSVDMDEDTIVSKVTGGIRMAAASSMRGVATP